MMQYMQKTDIAAKTGSMATLMQCFNKEVICLRAGCKMTRPQPFFCQHSSQLNVQRLRKKNFWDYTRLLWQGVNNINIKIWPTCICFIFTKCNVTVIGAVIYTDEYVYVGYKSHPSSSLLPNLSSVTSLCSLPHLCLHPSLSTSSPSPPYYNFNSVPPATALCCWLHFFWRLDANMKYTQGNKDTLGPQTHPYVDTAAVNTNSISPSLSHTNTQGEREVQQVLLTGQFGDSGKVMDRGSERTSI